LTPICPNIPTKSFISRGFAPDPTGELTELPRPLAVFKGLLLKEGERREGKKRRW